MLPLLQRSFDSAESAVSLARSVATNHVAPLSIAVSHGIDLSLLMAPLRALRPTHPGALFRIRRGSAVEIARMLKDGEADLALAASLEESWDRLDCRPLFTESFELAVARSHALASQPRVDLARLARETLLIQSGDECAGELRRKLVAAGAAEPAAHEVESPADLLALLEAGFGVALLPQSFPQSASRPETLRRLPVDGLDLRRTVALYAVAGRRRSPAAAALADLIRGAAPRSRAA
jgi:DNA-binding transcriptional LysR family regulator